MRGTSSWLEEEEEEGRSQPEEKKRGRAEAEGAAWLNHISHMGPMVAWLLLPKSEEGERRGQRPFSVCLCIELGCT